MNRYLFVVALGVGFTAFSGSNAASAVDGLLDAYRRPDAELFDATAGRELWNQTFTHNKTPQARSCASCHMADPRKTGKHARTGKPIKPLAPSVNPERFTDANKVRKWFKRNCKWTLGRECTEREQGNLLTYLKEL